MPQVDTPTFLGVTLDTRLTWKPHIEAVEARSIKRLSHMKKLAGTKWGANSGILRQVYSGSVRPIAEYASTTWKIASTANRYKLDEVQNMGLGIILGAMTSTPISRMEKNPADLQPRGTRREYKTLAQTEKAKRLPSHPLHDKLQYRTKNRLRRRSLNHVVKDLQRQHADILEQTPSQTGELFPKIWKPRHSSPEIRPGVPGLGAKWDLLPVQQKILTLEMIQHRYPQSSWTHASTENAVRNGGSGAYIRYPDGTTFSLSVAVGLLSSNYRAEVPHCCHRTHGC